MKKLILILAIAVVAIAARGQTATIELSEDISFYTVNTDYTLTNTTETWFKFDIAKDYPVTQDFQVNLDSLSGNHTNIAIALYGRKFDGDAWTQIGSTVNSTDGTATETISNTSPNRYREYKVSLTGTGTGTTTIDWMKFKVWRE